MFYSRRDLICSLFWIVLMCILAYLPWTVEEPENLQHSIDFFQKSGKR